MRRALAAGCATDWTIQRHLDCEEGRALFILSKHPKRPASPKIDAGVSYELADDLEGDVARRGLIRDFGTVLICI
jgi:hypothetical protein